MLVPALIARARQIGAQETGLDDAVHDAVGPTPPRSTTAGRAAQIGYLAARCGSATCEPRCTALRQNAADARTTPNPARTGGGATRPPSVVGGGRVVYHCRIALTHAYRFVSRPIRMRVPGIGSTHETSHTDRILYVGILGSGTPRTGIDPHKPPKEDTPMAGHHLAHGTVRITTPASVPAHAITTAVGSC